MQNSKMILYDINLDFFSCVTVLVQVLLCEPVESLTHAFADANMVSELSY